ncbi:selenium metabolism-associated LysR family transcriptional regulator [Fusibacter sp. 3D3]|uniref:selenium metabolism-associated LysR family transcriptional regulator n=1 Tax=Fusibacter sp. 3D3 TaxID=1048380 RepID=UPI0008533DB2|nr:selenium metabolism-associated LysR family transcriptional regulator [Fusibacter sp. 3D3]GAU76314.1 transcriptional regulator [Fusibacter sp. 3D3]
MDFRQLEAFVNVAKYKNFSKAAKALYLSQPTISLHISNLEKELNLSLFDRTSKEVNLTPRGTEFLNYALDMINMKNKALHQLTASDIKITGSLHISTSSTPNIILLPRAISDFQAIHPEVRFVVEEKSSTVIIEDVCSLAADLGIVGMKVESDRFICLPLFQDDLIFICPMDSDIKEVISYTELLQYNLISRSEQSGSRIDFQRHLVEQGHDVSLLETVVVTDDLGLMLSLVSRGVGFAYVSQTVFEVFSKQLPLRAFKIKGIHIERSMHLLINKRRTLSHAAEDFKQLLLSYYKKGDNHP